MKPIWYRTRSWARGRWGAAVVLAVVVAVAGGAVLTLLAGARRTLTAPDRYSAWRGRLFDVTIQQNHGAPLLTEVDALPATGRVEMATFVFGGLKTADGTSAPDSLVFAGTQGPLGTRLVAGREADPARPDEFVATRSFVRDAHAHVGQQFTLVTLTQAQADQTGFDTPSPARPMLTATLVGVIQGLNELGDVHSVVLFSRSLLRQGDIGVSASVGVASLAPGATIESLRAQLDGLGSGDRFTIDRATWVSSDIRAAVNAQGEGLLIVAVIVAFAAVVVVGQLLTRQLRVPDGERTVLLSLGMRPAQVVAEPVCRAAIAVAAGAAGAMVVASAASRLFPVGFVRQVEPHLGLRVDAVAVGLGALLLALALMSWLTVALVIDGRAVTTPTRPTVADKVARSVPSGKLSVAVRFAFAGAGGRRRSSLAPLLGLVLVVAVISGAIVFGSNLVRLSTAPREWGSNFDLAIGSGANEIAPEVVDRLEGSPDVGALTLYGTTSATVGARSVSVVGVDAVRGQLLPELVSGRLPERAGEMAVVPTAARVLHLHVGSTITLRGTDGERALRVTGFVLVPPVGAADTLATTALVTRDGFLDLDGSATMSMVAIRVAGHRPGGAPQRISALAEAGVGQPDPPSAILNLHRVRTIPFLVAAAVGLLAVLSLSHLMIVSVRRRRRDIAILRALGATPRWLGRVVRWQATLTVAAVLVVAVPVGVALGRAIYEEFVRHVGSRIDAGVPVVWFLLLAVVLIAFANVVAAVSGRMGLREPPALVLSRE